MIIWRRKIGGIERRYRADFAHQNKDGFQMPFFMLTYEDRLWAKRHKEKKIEWAGVIWDIGWYWFFNTFIEKEVRSGETDN